MSSVEERDIAIVALLVEEFVALLLLLLFTDSFAFTYALAFHRTSDVWIDKGVVREAPISEVKARCLKRIALIEAIANGLPSGTIRFGCQVLSVDVERSSSSPVVQLHNGSIIKAKVLIGCDGANSIAANFIGLKPTQPFSRSAVRGLTIYPNGHGFVPVFLRIRKDAQLVGRTPIDEKIVYWFIVLCENIIDDAEIAKDPTLIKKLTLDATIGFPTDVVQNDKGQ